MIECVNALKSCQIEEEYLKLPDKEEILKINSFLGIPGLTYYMGNKTEKQNCRHVTMTTTYTSTVKADIGKPTFYYGRGGLRELKNPLIFGKYYVSNKMTIRRKKMATVQRRKIGD